MQDIDFLLSLQGHAMIIKQLWTKCRLHTIVRLSKARVNFMDGPQSVHFYDVVRSFYGIFKTGFLFELVYDQNDAKTTF